MGRNKRKGKGGGGKGKGKGKKKAKTESVARRQLQSGEASRNSWCLLVKSLRCVGETMELTIMKMFMMFLGIHMSCGKKIDN